MSSAAAGRERGAACSGSASGFLAGWRTRTERKRRTRVSAPGLVGVGERPTGAGTGGNASSFTSSRGSARYASQSRAKLGKRAAVRRASGMGREIEAREDDGRTACVAEGWSLLCACFLCGRETKTTVRSDACVRRVRGG
jgi:hypothetical protein